MRTGWRAGVLPGLALLALEAWARTAGRHSDVLTGPSAAALAWVAMLRDGSLWEASAFTLGTAAAGLLWGAALGIPLGTWLGLSPRIARLGFVSIEALRPVPAVALVPLSMLAFGFGATMQISLVGFACFWPMLLLTQAAVRQIEPQWLAVAQGLGFGAWQRFTKVIAPAIAARLFVALRLCIGLALVVAVTVELAANPHGMGYAMLIAQQSLEPERMLAWLAWIALIGWALNTAAVALERAVSRRMQGQA